MKVIRFIATAAILVLKVTIASAQNSNVIKVDKLPIFQQSGRPVIFLPSSDPTLVSLSRSVGGADSSFTRLTLHKRAKDQDELLAEIGPKLAEDLEKWLRLKNNAELWTYFSTHDNPADYGIFVLDQKLMIALGRLFIDDNLASQRLGTVVYYRLTYKNNGQQQNYNGRFVIGAPVVMPKPAHVSHYQKDSVLVLKWAQPDKAGSRKPISARLFMKQDNEATFIERQTPVYLSSNKDSLIFTTNYPVKPQKFYSYYIRTFDIMGNANPQVSDTVSVYTTDPRPLPIVKDFSSADTIDGILLKWAKLNTDRSISGLVIERSATKHGPYRVIDTLSASVASFTDKNVSDGKTFYYQAYYIGAVKAPRVPFIPFTFNTHVSRMPLLAPYGVISTATPNKIIVSWQKVDGAAGYYVYRGATNDSSRLSCISKILSDTATHFTDTIMRLSRRQYYYYAVRACNVKGKPGAISLLASVKPITTTEKVSVPGSLELTVVDSVMHLSWPDLKILDPYVTGYNVYRSSVPATIAKVGASSPATVMAKKVHFTKLNGTPIWGTLFVDKTWTDTIRYSYAISAVDIDGAESALSAPVSAALFSNASTQFSQPKIVIKKLAKGGVEVSWAKISDLRADARLVIYRRSGVNAKPIEIGAVYGYINSFVDATAKANKVYQYQLVVAK